ncbi:MAG: hypothetical protein QGG71_25775 [Pirellulaceae bacterium]|jgi:hypothetical protein|nr:hypothetical protein [Pirellulaceae bacterium]
MLRYSLGSLFLALLYLSVGCAALVNATGIWPQVAITLTIAILVLFSLGAIFWTERRRVFAIGFMATGWMYFLLVFSDATSVRPYLLTETAMNRLFVTVHGAEYVSNRAVYQAVGVSGIQTAVYTAPVPPPLPPPFVNVGKSPTPTYYPTVAVRPTVDPRSFANIGHSMWALIVAFAGGVTAQLLAKRKKRVSKSGDEPPV